MRTTFIVSVERARSVTVTASAGLERLFLKNHPRRSSSGWRLVRRYGR
ncbi:MAG: hypothetical protein WKF84_23825 [Pyrinomonadaceae bacterium]